MFTRLALLAVLLLQALGLTGCNRDPQTASSPAPTLSTEFLGLMTTGKNFLDQGDATNALVHFQKAAALAPNNVDARLNLANAHLLAGEEAAAIKEADTVVKLTPDSAAAYFVKGSAYLRLGNAADAAKALENVRQIDQGDSATRFQLGRARMGLRQWEEAVTAFREGLAMDPNRLHTAAHYLLGQALLRAGHEEEGRQEMQQHAAGVEAGRGGEAVSTATFERSKYTQARVPFRLEQPDAAGVGVKFVDATREAFGEIANRYSGPLGIIDVHHTGANSLFVRETGQGFRLLVNSNGVFQPDADSYPALPGGRYHAMLVGDLQNDRFDDVIVLGDQGSHLFAFGTNGQARDLSVPSHLDTVRARAGALMDLDFTGKLDLLAVADPVNELRLFRQLGPLLFTNITANSGIPAALQNARSVQIEDWNRDENTDVVVGRSDGPPLLLEKRRGGKLVPQSPPAWVAGAVSCTGDFDNDLRPDLAVLGEGRLRVCFNGGATVELAVADPADFQQILAIDYDNDGWLDLWLVGKNLRAWRNVGLAGFREQTRELGVDAFAGGAVSAIHFADFDQDCDSDAVVTFADGGLRYLRNEGGNAHTQVKVQLFGNRSNASGIGSKVEIQAGGLRVFRTVQRLPVEVGVGSYQKLDSFLVHWFNWPQGSADLPVTCPEPILAAEATIQEGSCPYLYAWDGRGYRFVTDILGAAPLGLPLSEGRFVEADPEELVWIGTEETFPPSEGRYRVQITEELREVLYLDEAKLVVVDHAPATEVHPTDKLLPSGPFPPGRLLTLQHEHPLQRAETLDGEDVTSSLRAVDGQRVSPPKLRVPQLRGLAEPHGWVLDFGPLDTRQPLVLVLNGWLRFGGGMANIAASHDPALPFPFPQLEAEVAPGRWDAVPVTVGAPAGKTKTILVDLEGRLKSGTRRLRLTQAFEIHWDRIALLEKEANAATTVTFRAPDRADLQFRGFSELKDLPSDWPPTPDYARTQPHACWTLIPEGWSTRYGEVSELVTTRDEGLALIHSGDALSLEFAATALPAKPAGWVREFFLYADGWDKDSDFHVATGTQIEPLPFHGQQDQRYGQEPRPAFPSDALHRKYNTRWVEGRVPARTAFSAANVASAGHDRPRPRAKGE